MIEIGINFHVWGILYWSRLIRVFFMFYYMPFHALSLESSILLCFMPFSLSLYEYISMFFNRLHDWSYSLDGFVLLLLFVYIDLFSLFIIILWCGANGIWLGGREEDDVTKWGLGVTLEVFTLEVIWVGLKELRGRWSWF